MDEAFLDRAFKIAHELEGLNDSFATEAAQALADAVAEIKHLEVKADHRTIIGQATGILMEREQVGSTTAFMMLVRLSSYSNRKLYAVARELTEADAQPHRRAPAPPPRTPSEAASADSSRE